MRPIPPSSGQAPAGFACLRLPLMSNVGPFVVRTRGEGAMERERVALTVNRRCMLTFIEEESCVRHLVFC